MIDIPPALLTMRASCPTCGCDTGAVVPKGGQMCVYCLGCDRHCYNAPKHELAGEDRPDPSKWVEPNLNLSEELFYVYRAFGAACSRQPNPYSLLYVGQTSRPKKRLRQHAGMEGDDPKPWASSVEYVSFEPHSTRILARGAEAIAIQAERPLHNFHYNVGIEWGCESSHCQVVEVDTTFQESWPQRRAIVDELALDAADEVGDPVVFKSGPFWWLAVDLPKVIPGSLDDLASTPSFKAVEGIKPIEFPVPEPLWPELRREGRVPRFAPPFPRREVAS